MTEQIRADGATWLDRHLVTRDAVELGEGGFGREVRRALEARTEHLIEQGFAHRSGEQVRLAGNMIATLGHREVDALGQRLASETGLSFARVKNGDSVSGIYRRRFLLASGRFAMMDDGLGFRLVPWVPSIERYFEKHISGIARNDGGIDWSFARKRGLGL
ncbi:DUF3363 domain-containing protein [Mesorhizobium sp. ZC-5]|uniref:DUF3363 domain-containing protein n=1 Tax=Mesorhizobium sp. ZC-5 TaxID=2986066 RepID=UPI002982A944|nr:DUF3363 domain-containing protein [Mesorhizobium sp. ZC-5]